MRVELDRSDIARMIKDWCMANGMDYSKVMREGPGSEDEYEDISDEEQQHTRKKKSKKSKKRNNKHAKKDGSCADSGRQKTKGRGKSDTPDEKQRPEDEEVIIGKGQRKKNNR
eukprot:gene3734-2219_t